MFNSDIVEPGKRQMVLSAPRSTVDHISQAAKMHRASNPNPNKVPPHMQNLLPPLHETSFSEQYKTFKALGGGTNFATGKTRANGTYNTGVPPLGHELEMSKDLQDMIRANVANRPYLKRSFQKPIFAEENYPIVANSGVRSVFRMAA